MSVLSNYTSASDLTYKLSSWYNSCNNSEQEDRPISINVRFVRLIFEEKEKKSVEQTDGPARI
jgi:hypothetical protein